MLRSSNFIRIQRENPFYLRTSDFKDAENPFVYCDDKKNRKLHRQRCIDHGQRTYSLYPMRIISTMHICIPYIDYTDRFVAYHLNSFGYCINAACRVPFGHLIGVQRTLISHIWNECVYAFRGMPLRKSTLLGSKCFTLAFCYFWFSVHIDVVRSIVRIFFFLLIPKWPNTIHTICSMEYSCVSSLSIFVIWIQSAYLLLFLPLINLIHGCIVLSRLLRFRLDSL